MFIRTSDLQCVKDKLADGVLREKALALVSGLSYAQRLRNHWNSKVKVQTPQRRRLFSEIPHVSARIARQYDGKDVTTWIFDAHLAGRRNLRAVSIGCGTANAELQMAELGRAKGVFSSLFGFDPSEGSLSVARQRADRMQLGNILQFAQGSIEELQFEEGSFDVAFAFSSLHHLRDVGRQLEHVHRWLRPGGLLIAHEYIGPSRQQYSAQRVALLNALFDALDPKYRLDWHSRHVRTKVPIPGGLLMWLYDPSEMVESADIAPSLRRLFQVVEFRPEIGTLLLCLLKEIAHNFPESDAEATAVLDGLCDIELAMIQSGLIEPDFATMVCMKRD